MDECTPKVCHFVLSLLQGSFQSQHCGLYSLSPVLLIPSCLSRGCGSGQQMQRAEHSACTAGTGARSSCRATAAAAAAEPCRARPNTAERSRIAGTAPRCKQRSSAAWSQTPGRWAVQHRQSSFQGVVCHCSLLSQDQGGGILASKSICHFHLRRPHGAFSILPLSWEKLCHCQAVGTTTILS